MNILKKITLIVAVASFFVVSVNVGGTANALFEGAKGEACKGANLSNSNSKCDEKKATDTIDKTIQFAVNLITTIVGIAAVIMIIVNGLKYVTSSGDSNSISSAKNGIIYAIVGLIIAALAQVIVRFVLSRVTP
jgi:hypothetical protein